MKRTILSPLLILFIALPTLAGVIYETDFEAPTYSVGELAGQNGWAITAGGGLQYVTNDITTPNGDQSVYVHDWDYEHDIDATGYTITKFSGLFKKNPEGASGWLDFKYPGMMAGINTDGVECWLNLNWDQYELRDDDHTAAGEWVYASFTVDWTTMWIIEAEFGPDEANAQKVTGQLLDITGTPFPTRIVLGAWTGGDLDGSSYDDLKVEGLPEPGMLIALLSGIGFFLRRR